MMSLLQDIQYSLVCENCDHCIEESDEMSVACPECGDGFMRIDSRLGQCVCGEVIEFSHFTNTCECCGKDYNSSGQELAPREQWGEETGETAADILMLNNPEE
jgi:hypothetical protein